MEGEPLDDDDPEDSSLESLLEALLVDDAEVGWDPVTGQPHIRPREKSELDSPDGRA